ncbi:MAG: hypothetical protein KatS3mg110_3852 [Pirellulaceae bacterium]|nr:MAG: hypothetical protein KatS3mg110_3852 [Pirellulaceae bacterium]
MRYLAPIWTASGNASHQPILVRVVPGGNFDGRSFFSGQRLDAEEPIEHRTATLQHIASCGPHLSVAVLMERLLDKVDKTGFALKSRQQRQRFVSGGTRFSRRLWLASGFQRDCLRLPLVPQHLLEPARQLSIP